MQQQVLPSKDSTSTEWQMVSDAVRHCRCVVPCCVFYPYVSLRHQNSKKDHRTAQALCSVRQTPDKHCCWFAVYIGARAYNWQPMAGWHWWAYNENSGDICGIVYNNWNIFDWTKLNYMIKLLSMALWFKGELHIVKWLVPPYDHQY
eukprot:GHRR01019242.1.p2 GENE.GHRR01019242.1~~GHRR01019242.1.p2  ORF type:complete len:147 (+),score=25.74 GHRR01019242.1:1458-1898(+)